MHEHCNIRRSIGCSRRGYSSIIPTVSQLDHFLKPAICMLERYTSMLTMPGDGMVFHILMQPIRLNTTPLRVLSFRCTDAWFSRFCFKMKRKQICRIYLEQQFLGLSNFHFFELRYLLWNTYFHTIFQFECHKSTFSQILLWHWPVLISLQLLNCSTKTCIVIAVQYFKKYQNNYISLRSVEAYMRQ